MSVMAKSAISHNRLFNATIDLNRNKARKVFIIADKNKLL